MAGYDYEQLDDESFQELCQALLVKHFPTFQCLPVGQRDGGRDGFVWKRERGNRQLLLFQVKFVRNPSRIDDPHRWITGIVRDEAPKVDRIAQNADVGMYVLLTNVAGTAPLDSGSIDTADHALQSGLKVPSQCWWRADLDRRLDSEWDLKWRYPAVLTGPDFLRAVFELGMPEDRDRRLSAITAFVTHQHDADREVKFKQVELQNDLVDLFVDVPVTPVDREASRSQSERRVRQYLDIASALTDASVFGPDFDADVDTFYAGYALPPVGASRLLIHESCVSSFPRIVLEGAPGQGKSTLAQFACQVHRLHILNLHDEIAALPEHFRSIAVRIPIKVDLRDYATWLSKRDPFEPESDAPPAGWRKSFESFLSHQITHMSGSIHFTAADLHAVLRVSAALLVLDGLDEVADISTRATLISEITSAVKRLESDSASLLTVVTSRPANFANSPGFSERDFSYFELMALPRPLIDDYVGKWIIAKNLDPKDSADVRAIVRQRIDEPHLRELARNPMQLAILLSVVHTRGASLPDKRTALYNIYIDIFFNREAEKDDGVRRNRELLIDIHGYVAWILQTEAEQGGDGRISLERLKQSLVTYLQREERDVALVDELFREMAQRVLALVSRIQGTLEFEVQPLREYFAARYLYETAPPSPVGNEQHGSKPDRFAALASNFYWLNVARFYAGFYQKGELPSLAQQLEELAESAGFRNTSHPHALAVALLSDWVFSQSPRSMRQVVSLVTDGIGIGEISPSPSGQRQARELRLPEGNGRAELASRCFDLLRGYPPMDLAGELSDVVMVNSDPLTIKREWLSELEEAVSDSSHRICDWLALGGRLGLRSTVRADEIRIRLSDRLDEGPILQTAYRWICPEIISGDRVSAERLVTSALKDELGYVSAAFGMEGTQLDYVLATFSPTVWAMALESSSSDLPLDEVLWRRQRPGNIEPPNDVGPDIWPDPIRSLLAACREARSMPGAAWSSSLAPWSIVVDEALKEWGECQSLLAMASIGAGVKARHETGEGAEDLFDASRPLVQRMRYARLRSGSGSWWSSKLGSVTDDHQRDLCLVAIARWGGPSVFKECGSEVDRLLSTLTDDQYGRLVTSIRPRAFRGVRLRKRDLVDGASDHLAVLLALRSDFATRQYVSDRLRSSAASGLSMLRFRADTIQQKDELGPDDWEELVDLAELAYVDRISLIRRRLGRPAQAMPSHLAERITTSPELFPRVLVASAEAVCRSDLGNAMTPVSDAAAAGRWFGPG